MVDGSHSPTRVASSLIDADGTNMVRLADGSEPAGHRTASGSSTSPRPKSTLEPGDLWVVSADGGEPHLVGAYQAGAW